MLAIRYSFKCPKCEEVIDSGNEFFLLNERTDINTAIYNKHPHCPKCGELFPGEHNIPIKVRESLSGAK